MRAVPPEVPGDRTGRPLTGAALESWQRAEAERRAAVEAREDVAALARMVCRLAARGMSMPAPDALAAIGARSGPAGQQDALRCLRAAGYSPEPASQRWAEEAPLQRQSSRQTGDLYADDPAHDPRVTAALLAGRPRAEVAELVAEVAAERQRAQEEAASAAPGVMWTTRNGDVVRDGGPAAPLVPQRSAVRQSVPPLGAEGAVS